MAWYAIEVAKMARFVVLSQTEYDDPYRLPMGHGSSLDSVIEILTEIRDEIPEQFRDAALCEITGEGGWEGSYYAKIEISYCDPDA